MTTKNAYCVDVYREIGAGMRGNVVELGYGFNKLPPSPELMGHIGRVVTDMVRAGRMAEYTTAVDNAERTLFAALVSSFVDASIGLENVFWTIGGTEAISLVATHAAHPEARAPAAAVLLRVRPGMHAFRDCLRRLLRRRRPERPVA